MLVLSRLVHFYTQKKFWAECRIPYLYMAVSGWMHSSHPIGHCLPPAAQEPWSGSIAVTGRCVWNKNDVQFRSYMQVQQTVPSLALRPAVHWPGLCCSVNGPTIKIQGCLGTNELPSLGQLTALLSPGDTWS